MNLLELYLTNTIHFYGKGLSNKEITKDFDIIN